MTEYESVMRMEDEELRSLKQWLVRVRYSTFGVPFPRTDRKSTNWKTDTHCRKCGNEIRPETTYVYVDKKGLVHRTCVICTRRYQTAHQKARDRMRRWRARKKVA